MRDKKYQAVFAYPILPGKAEIQKQRLAEKKQIPKYQEDFLAYCAEMSWTNVAVWLQRLPKEELHILLIESNKPIDSDEICSRFRKRCESGCPMAKEIRSVYLETQGTDFCDRAAYATLQPLPDFPIEVSEEELDGKTVEEYAFAYPLISGGSDLLIEYNRSNFEDPLRLDYFKNMRKKLGLIEVCAWIQRGFGREMIVSHQKIIEPFAEARDKFYDVTIHEEMMQKHDEIYFKATGLTTEERTPNFEPL